MVKVREVGTPPNPLKVYSGMFNVLPTNVAAPLVPVVVRVSAFCLPLKVVQSVELSNPFCEPLAVAIANVIVPLVVIGVEPMVTPLVALDNPTDVTVPPLDGLVFVIVKFG